MYKYDSIAKVRLYMKIEIFVSLLLLSLAPMSLSANDRFADVQVIPAKLSESVYMLKGAGLNNPMCCTLEICFLKTCFLI